MIGSVAVNDHVSGPGGPGNLLAEGGEGASGAAHVVAFAGLEGERAVEFGERLVERV
jgi:hypothetical protein